MLWAGILLAAGVAGAMAARGARLPALTGAVAVGALASIAGLGLPADGLNLPIVPWLTAVLCFCLGASLEPATFLRSAPSIVRGAALQAAAVAACVLLAGRLAGFPWHTALMVAIASTVTAPAPLAALTAESRARGPATQSLLAPTPLLLSIALALALLFAHEASLLRPLAALASGALIGGILLVPLSRLARRSGILSAVLLAIPLLAAAASLLGAGEAGLALAAIAAGFVAVNFIPGRPLVRESLRDLAVPASIAWGVWMAAALPSEGLVAALPAALLVTAARGLALFATAPRPPRAAIPAAGDRLLQALAALPAAPALVLTPLLTEAVLATDPAAAPIIPLAAGITLVSLLAGLPMTARALARRGETAGDASDPDSWRGAMR